MEESILDKIRLYSLYIDNYNLTSSDDIISLKKKSPEVERKKQRKYSPDKEEGIVKGRGRSRGTGGRKKEDVAFVSEEGEKKPPSFLF